VGRRDDARGLLREHQRGGQSFIVVPRIADMAEVEDWLRSTCRKSAS
jgi:transcription-repair coupling factor (superfamily II helicase)